MQITSEIQRRSLTKLTKIDYIFSIAMAVCVVAFAAALVVMEL